MKNCKHNFDATDKFNGLFATPECPECRIIRSLYDDVWTAMAGNVYAQARLANAGYISGVKPTLASMYAAGNLLFEELSDADKAADLVGVEAALAAF